MSFTTVISTLHCGYLCTIVSALLNDMIFETKTMSEIAQLEDRVRVQLIFNESLRWLNVLDNRVANEENEGIKSFPIQIAHLISGLVYTLIF